ncbi:hypothetical protein R1sor_007569 [Riccia sorocarpa]|uniref:Ubiquitin carboxyl-terminal hydrolase n=1 Tax=Riccia sorocarpa TaxID=122646 RepID=A0ABD3HQV1_9MARC
MYEPTRSQEERQREGKACLRCLSRNQIPRNEHGFSAIPSNMTEPVFLFGSFTEDEAQKFQLSVPELHNAKEKVSPPVKHAAKENGLHPAQSKSSANLSTGGLYVAGKVGVGPKTPQNTSNRVVSNGKHPENVSSPSRTTGRGARKSPATSSEPPAVRKAAKEGEVKAAVEIVHQGVTLPSRIAKETAPESSDQSEWTYLSSQEVSDSNIPEANGQALSYAVVTPLKRTTVPSGNGEIEQKVGTCTLVSSQSGTVVQKISGVHQSEETRSQENDDFDASSARTTSDVNAETVVPDAVPKSWAALVGVPSDDGGINGIPGLPTLKKSNDGQKRLSGPNQIQVPLVTALSGDEWLSSLRQADVVGRRILPRGLVNTGNSCFLNSTMQAMLSCPPFTHLLQVLKARSVPEEGYPTLRAFVDFFKEFEPSPDTNSPKPAGRRETNGKIPAAEVGRPFVPAMFDPILQSFTPDQPPRSKGKNRQEDAQEFLSFVMDRMHEEILRLQSQDSPVAQISPAVSSVEDEDWEMVGPKNRTSVTRTYTFTESAVTDIFGGQLRSVVKTKGNKASATVQPFLLLQLDIVPEFVHSVEDALRMFAAPESLEGYKPATGKVGGVVAASKAVKIHTLPRVLILHLMRFSYGSGGSSKLHKHVQFPLEITLSREMLASPTGSGNEQRRYELVATISHHGKDPSVGHYTADSKQANGQWLRFDDGNVSAVSVGRVLQEQVYVLFYKRLGV